MAGFALNQKVGNFKTHKVGTIISEPFRGASGEFRGFLIQTDLYGQEIWEESSIVLLPSAHMNSEPPAQK